MYALLLVASGIVALGAGSVGGAAAAVSTKSSTPRFSAATQVEQAQSSTSTTYVQPDVTSRSDGGESTSYALPNGQEIVTVTPPTDFNPLTASDETLAEYGFPTKPADPAQQARWQAAMAAYRSDDPPAGPLPVTTSGPAFVVYSNWAGWTAGDWAGTGNTYVAVKGDQTVPSPTNTCSDTNVVGFWIGLGGTNGDLVQQGFECGDSELGTGSAFRPFTEFANLEAPVNFCGYASWTLPHGDTIYQNMSFETSIHTANFFLEDITTGTTHSCSVTKPSGWTFSGNTADWEAEAPGGTTVNFGSVTFTNSQAELNSTGAWVTLGSQTTTKEVQGDSSTYYCISPGSISSGTQFTDSYHQASCY
jgi:hypothetical protein